MRFFDYLVETHTKESDESSMTLSERIQLLQLQHTAVVRAQRKHSIRMNKLFKELEQVPNASLGAVQSGHVEDPNIIVCFGEKFKKTPETLELYSRYLIAEKRRANWQRKEEKLRADLKTLVDEHTAAQLTKRAANRKNISPIPEDQVPAKVGKSLTSPPRLDNPYFKGSSGRWAGHPDGFAFTPVYRREFELFELYLERAGLPGFTLLYGSDYMHKGHRLQNFIVYAVDGKLAWRRYNGNAASPSVIEIFANGQKVFLNYDTFSTHEVKTLFPEYFNEGQ